MLASREAVLAEDVSRDRYLRGRESISELGATSLICAPVTFGIWIRPSRASTPPAGGLKLARTVSIRAEVHRPAPSLSGVIRRLPAPSWARLAVLLV